MWTHARPEPNALAVGAVDYLPKPKIDLAATLGDYAEELCAKIKAAARDALATGFAKGARLAAEEYGVHDTAELDAIENATKAAIKEKGQAPP